MATVGTPGRVRCQTSWPVRGYSSRSRACLLFSLFKRAYGQEPTLEVFYSKLALPKRNSITVGRGRKRPALRVFSNGKCRRPNSAPTDSTAISPATVRKSASPITANKLYRFRTNSIYAVENYEGLAGHEQGPLAAQRRAPYVKELFGRYYRDPVLKAANEDEAIALQVALWEVIQETEPAEGSTKLDLFAGDFQANYPRDQTPGYVRTRVKLSGFADRQRRGFLQECGTARTRTRSAEGN